MATIDTFTPGSSSYFMKSYNRQPASMVGGFSSNTGQSLYVTPSGTPVASAEIPRKTVVNNTQPSGGGGGGGGMSGQQNVDWYINEFGNQVPIEDTSAADAARAEAERIINEAYNSAVGALEEFKGTLQPGFEQQQSELLGQQASQTARAREDEIRKVGELTQQGTEETGKAESAMAKSRREASEMMSGLSARFGGSTGTGMFGGEILGRQALENIAGSRQALQYVMGKITSAQQSIKRETDLFVNNIEQQTQDLIGKARQQLNQSLADVASRRGELESAKAQMRLDALGQYQDTINAINQRNTALKQDIYLKAQAASQRLTSMQQEEVPQYQFAYDPKLGLQMSGNISSQNAPELYGIYNQAVQGGFPQNPIAEEEEAKTAYQKLGSPAGW